MPQGLFITLEGLDGSGKTTQIKRLAAWFEKRSLHPVVTRQPGGTATGDRIRPLLLDSRSTGLAPMTEMALMFADRAQTIAEVIRPALDAGKIVLCDRYTDSTEAYQGGGRELGSEIVLELHRIICGNLQPDLTLLLLPSLTASLDRARSLNDRHTANTGQD
jgi:dTMP kinase